MNKHILVLLTLSLLIVHAFKFPSDEVVNSIDSSFGRYGLSDKQMAFVLI